MIDDRVRGDVTGTDFDPARPGGPLLVSVTPFGFDADDAEDGAIEHDVLAQARAGIIGVQGDPGREPLRMPGLAGAVPGRGHGGGGRARRPADARRPPRRRLVDGLPDDRVRAALRRRAHRRAAVAADRPVPDHRLPRRRAAVPRRLRRAGQLPRHRLGDAVPAVRTARAARRRPLPAPAPTRAVRVDEVWERIRGWYAERHKDEIFQLALDTPWTVGKVMTGLDALADAHLAERGFIGSPRDAGWRGRGADPPVPH